VIDATIQLLLHAETAPVEQVDRILEALVPSQRIELIGMLLEIYRDRPVAQHQLEFVHRLASALHETELRRGLAGPSREFDRFVQQLTLSKLQREIFFEGSYAASINGTAGRVTLVLSGGGGLIVGVQKAFRGNLIGGTNLSFARTNYDFATGLFTGHRFSAESVEYLPPDERNAHISFRLSRDEKGRLRLTGEFTNGLGPERIDAVQDARLEPFREPAKIQEWTPLNQRFAGGSWELTVTQVGHELSGHLNYRNRMAEIYLPIGFVNPRTRVLHLNSAEQIGGNYIQLRGQLSEDGRVLRGYYIIGGRGFTPITLVRE
jgi:hypothetical protein